MKIPTIQSFLLSLRHGAMKTTRCAILYVLTSCRGGDATIDTNVTADAPADAFVGGLAGTWIVTVFNGGPGSPDLWTFTDATLTVLADGLTFNGSYTVDPAATPQQIDISLSGAALDPNLAIYRFDNATRLILKLQNTEGPRATTFNVEPEYDLLELSNQ